MSENILFKEEITSSLTKLVNDKKEVEWPGLLKDMKDFIVSHFDGKNLAREHGDWKRRLKAVAKILGVKIIKFGEDAWQDIHKELAELQAQLKATTQSSGINHKLSDQEKCRIIAKYDSIKEEDHWVLKTGTIVDLKMKALANVSSYEHPVHSMILDPDDKVWNDYFTLEELKEIKECNPKPLESVPADFNSYLDLYDKEWESGVDLYEFADGQKHHPINEPEKKWIKGSMMAVSDLFLYQQELILNDYSESDLLHKLWSFVYTQFANNSLRAMLGERCSVAVAIARNNERTLECQEKRQRKIMGAKVDILFKSGTNELGSCEVGKDDVIIVDDKYMDDGMVKLPKTLRDMLSTLVQKNPAKINELTTTGFLMMGLKMELLQMDIPKGNSISRVLRTKKFDFPSCCKNVGVDFIPLLEIAWKGKKAMEKTIDKLNDRKRKSTALSTSMENSVLLDQSFYHAL